MNRVRRSIGWEDAGDVSDRVSVIITDHIASAQREALETAEWDFDIRNNGILTTIPPYEYPTTTGQLNVSQGAATLTVLSTSDYGVFTVGESRSRINVPTDANFGDSYFILLDGRHPTVHDVYTLETEWPGTTLGFADDAGARIVTSEYVLPTTVRDVLSVTVEEKQVAVQFIEKDAEFDAIVPNAFQEESDSPQVCFVGGNTIPTVVNGTTATPGLGLWLYPVPSEAYVVRYTYRYRHPALTASTDTLQVPDQIIDDIVDLATARTLRSKIAHDPEMAKQMEITTQARLRRKQQMTSAQPMMRRSLGSHDRYGMRNQFGSKPRNPREFV